MASSNLKHLTNLLYKASKGRFSKEIANNIREAAMKSIGSHSLAKSLELRHTLTLIHELSREISEIEAEIKLIMDNIDSPILSISGIGQSLGFIIVAEIGDISRFSSPDKILAFAGCSPSTYQSGQLYSSHARMEKLGSKYLRWALFNATRYVCQWKPTFASYLVLRKNEPRANITISLYLMLQKTGSPYLQS